MHNIVLLATVLFVSNQFVHSASAGSIDEPLNVCVNNGCDERETVALTPEQVANIKDLFSVPATDPASERKLISRAISKLEVYTGEITGTDNDRAGTWGNFWKPGQLDCISESTNTTTYIEAMSASGLLKWYKAVETEWRSEWLLYGHLTAVIEDQSSGRRYAVDSWVEDNGGPPLIQTLEDWQDKKPPQQ